jgi:hypothetical protein
MFGNEFTGCWYVIFIFIILGINSISVHLLFNPIFALIAVVTYVILLRVLRLEYKRLLLELKENIIEIDNIKKVDYIYSMDSIGGATIKKCVKVKQAVYPKGKEPKNKSLKGGKHRHE